MFERWSGSVCYRELAPFWGCAAGGCVCQLLERFGPRVAIPQSLPAAAAQVPVFVAGDVHAKRGAIFGDGFVVAAETVERVAPGDLE